MKDAKRIKILRNTLDTILHEAKEPIIKVYAQSALDETKELPTPEPPQEKNAYCKTHKWYGHNNEKCPLCCEAARRAKQ